VTTSIAELAQVVLPRISATTAKGRRRLIAIVGGPASGKSTLADHLAAAMPNARVVPMDGFHLDNSILQARGLLPKKGAPETFDALGFLHLVQRLRVEDMVYHPVFDRKLDKSIAAGGVVDADCTTVIVEGNYLLFDAPIWRDLKGEWDLSVMLDLPVDVLEERLVKRWLDHGLSATEARARAQENDLANARLIARHSITADLCI